MTRYNLRVWQQQGKGVSLPRKDTDSPKGPKNHKGKWEERSFQWPEGLDNIKAYKRKVTLKDTTFIGAQRF